MFAFYADCKNVDKTKKRTGTVTVYMIITRRYTRVTRGRAIETFRNDDTRGGGVRKQMINQ